MKILDWVGEYMKKELKIGLLGLGVVATGLVERLAAQKEKIEAQTGVSLLIDKVLVLDPKEKAELAKQHGFELVTTIDEITEDPTIDIVIELIGRISPAKEYILAAIANGKHVVTANKDLIAQHGAQIVEAADNKGVGFYYEASVGGGIPLLRPLATSYQADTITSVRGIVNGTTNYMLTKMMEEQMDYETALKQAQQLGFAESDPTNDVDGIDAAYKVIILGAFAFGAQLTLEDVSIQGIRQVQAKDVEKAQTLGYEIKLIGEVKQTQNGVVARVAPTLVPKMHPLAMIKNEYNGVFVESEGIGQSLIYGPGAGALPTATSVVADLIEIAKRVKAGQTFEPFNTNSQVGSLADATTVKENAFISVVWNEQPTTVDAFLQGLVDQGYTFAYQSFDADDKRLTLIVKEVTKTAYNALIDALNAQGMVEGQLGLMGDFNEN